MSRFDLNSDVFSVLTLTLQFDLFLLLFLLLFLILLLLLLLPPPTPNFLDTTLCRLFVSHHIIALI